MQAFSTLFSGCLVKEKLKPLGPTVSSREQYCAIIVQARSSPWCSRGHISRGIESLHIRKGWAQLLATPPSAASDFPGELGGGICVPRLRPPSCSSCVLPRLCFSARDSIFSCFDSCRMNVTAIGKGETRNAGHGAHVVPRSLLPNKHLFNMLELANVL